MSRVGKQPVTIPSGVKVAIGAGEVTVEGPKGKLSQRISALVKVEQQDGALQVSPLSESKQARADYGTARSLLNNMVLGVTQGWSKKLELVGVGFTAALQGNQLVLNTGYSHQTKMDVPADVTCKAQKTEIELESADKQALGQFAARVRRVCPPEPYLGKGIKYSDEVVRRKAGKTGK